MPRRSPRKVSIWTNVDLFLTQRDSLSALIVWVMLEGLGLMLLPSFQLIRGPNRYQNWLLLSLPLGIVGAVLIGISSAWLKYSHEQFSRRYPHKKLFLGFGAVASWLGLAGIGFPLIMIAIELWLLITKGLSST
jgi:hypothetical protein